jgi:peptidoglycan endopeptidase LytE
MKKKVATIATAAVLTSTFSTTVFADTYKVEQGDTLTHIAQKYNTTTRDLMSLNGLSSDRIYANQNLTVTATTASKNTQPTTTAKAVPTPAPSAKTYTVVSGDTLIKIANQHGISLGELKNWNNQDSHIIYPGQVFNVSGASGTVSQTTKPATPTITASTPTENASSSQYVIKRGDTLSKIANQVGLSVQQLKTFNNLNSDLIFAGQTLSLSQKSGSASVSQPASGKNQSNPIVQTGAPVVSQSIAAVINEAKKLVGTPYVWGGSTVSGFDCSGFIYYVFNKAGQSMNRTSAQGYYDRSYEVNTPQVGDLVFFENTYKAGISHLGVYLGGNQFIHAGSDGVQISSVSSGYWKDHFESFKRFY